MLRRLQAFGAMSLLVLGFTLPGSANSQAVPEAAAQFKSLSDDYLAYIFAANPGRATEEGIHDYDGKLKDLSKQGVEKDRQKLRQFLARLEQINPDALEGASRDDYELVVNDVRSSLLELDDVTMWRKDPDLYSSMASASIFSLIKRDFAPFAERLRSVIAREKEIPRLLANGRANLQTPPRIYTEIALEQLPGIIAFFRDSVPAAFKTVEDKRLLGEFHETNGLVISELSAYERFLKEDLLPRSTGSFALGPDVYRKKLLYEEMVDTPLDVLVERGYAELRRLQAEFKQTAGLIDNKRDAREVFASLSADHPEPAKLLTSVRSVLEEIRSFCVDRQIVTIPSNERARVEETPPFMRALSFASMDTPGPFEKKAKEAYYHVTLPEAGWPAKKVEEHMRSFSHLDLLNTSIHEAYPGHYVQFLWVPSTPTDVRKVIGCGSNAEGWAHYCEQMMLDEGFGKGDPKLRLTQIHDALLRACRYIVGIRMHTQNMTLDEGVKFFADEGYQEQANAEREAKRGTMDPTYLVYTLGKLDILALRDDFQKAQGKNYSLKEFHDRFLGQGFPPIKIVRAALIPGSKPLAMR